MQNTTASTTPSGRRTTAALLAGPIVTIAGLAATPWETERSTAAYHQALAASPDQAQIAAVLLSFGYALLGLSAFTALRRMGSRHRRHVAVAGVLSFLGATLMPGQLVTDFYDLAMAQTLPAADAVRASDATQALPFAGVLMAPAIVGFLFGPVALSSLAARERLVGWWAPVALVIGLVAPMAVYSPAAILVGGLGLLAFYVALASGVARRGRPVAAPSTERRESRVTIGAPAPAPPRW